MRDCIVIHGYNSKAKDMLEVYNHLRQLPFSNQWKFHLVEYETYLTSFRDSATTLARQLQKTQSFNKVIFVGYSMGGLVARQMVGDGFPCSALVAINTPHLGTAPWVPTPGSGANSQSPHSKDLKTLNANTFDILNRKHYAFFGMSFRDKLGYHADDRLVTLASALGKNLSGIERQVEIPLNYGANREAPQLISGSGPHLEGQRPESIHLVSQHCTQLFRVI